MHLPSVTALRYVTPLREGGSLPGVVEADDLGTYVVKFRGAGQGPKALVAEVIVGELARRLGLPMPDLAQMEFGEVLGRAEPDPEVQELLLNSAGSNLGMDFLPGSLGFDPRVHKVDSGLADRVVWLDALVENVDRTWRNPNLLMWHGSLWLIDHGASLYFHHNWASAANNVLRPFKAADHVLAGQSTSVESAHEALAPLVTPELLTEVLDLVPDEWLVDPNSWTTDFETPAAARAAYIAHLLARVEQPAAWLPSREGVA
ncbi:MAG: aminotransferase class I and II [Hamadaea sp.]|uniref:HipA family kinase n=1 Tax=Hamadaea sp. TaxID=2024425 RepID=UPI0017F6E245|nr:HipA family kinase [Hamadaea sp.]NUR72450.1 aminotransferase class I and II [Hamadaea sp.]NUT22234.1 aminotransferase class I and II [Hamadaea sp.]